MQHLSFLWFHFTLANDTLPSKRPCSTFWPLSPVTLALTFYYWERCPRCSWWTCPCWHPSPWQRARNSVCGPATPSVCMIENTNNYSEISHDRIYWSSPCAALTEVFTRVNNNNNNNDLYRKSTWIVFDLLTFAAEIHEHGVHWQEP